MKSAFHDISLTVSRGSEYINLYIKSAEIDILEMRQRKNFIAHTHKQSFVV